jgi:eukaryotic-like serine/threonine-protein kinase
VTRDLFKPGDWIDRYEILGRLRAGGMATLFLGRRHGAAGVSKPVAIKVIHPHLAEDEHIVNMFIDEARISSQISHSNVVYIETFGEHDGVYYIVMEYVDGCSLQQVLKMLAQRREQLAPAMAVRLVLEAAAGLHAAHETAGEDRAPLGIVHRDVSPSNVLLARDGRVKVIDFGIAKARNRLGETRAGSKLKGKLAYMAPEQAWGKDTDRRTDVYALGVVLWELLAAKPLFRADDEIAMLELVRAPDVPPPSRFNPDVTQALDAVVSRALAKLPEHRLQTAAELRRELAQAVPQAAALPSELVAQLVERVRETLGVAEPEDMKPTTPVAPSVQIESAVRTAAGEIATAPARPGRRWLAIGGGLVAVAGIVGVLAYTRMNETTAAVVATPQPKPAVTIDAAVPAPRPPPPPAPPPAPAATKPVVVKRTKPKPPAPANVRALEVDGAVLADKPGAKTPPPPPKSRDAVKVGDEVLVK